MKRLLLKILGLLHTTDDGYIYYIGGSDVLPPPLKGMEEQSALEELEKNCADNTLWNGNKPADCDAATNPFIGLLEKLK